MLVPVAVESSILSGAPPPGKRRPTPPEKREPKAPKDAKDPKEAMAAAKGGATELERAKDVNQVKPRSKSTKPKVGDTVIITKKTAHGSLMLEF